MTFKTLDMVNDERSPEKRELVDEIHRRMSRGISSESSAREIIDAILKVVKADQGFIGIFENSGSDIYREIASANLRDNDVIEVADPLFAQHLQNGEPIQESATLLIPLRLDDKPQGFICVHRRDAGCAFSASDVDYLVALGELSWLRTDEVWNETSHNNGEPIIWPLELIGKSDVMARLGKQIGAAASTDMNVLILGETGSGKELVANAIHRQSRKAAGPFVARNCPQTTESLAETEIFGYAPKSGIAEGNPHGTPGWFELADGGTLFLDEIHRLSGCMQDKFLRVLQDKEVRRFGSQTSTRVDVKVLAATDDDLSVAIEEGRMRRPFYHRFGMRIEVPALRHRRADIPLLAYYFLDKYARLLRSRTRVISHRGLRCLTEYDWPGNVRQLEHVIHASVAKDCEVLFSWDLQQQFENPRKRSTRENDQVELNIERPVNSATAPRKMDEVEREQIMEALEAVHGNVTKAAQLLGYKSRQTMLNKMDRYGIPRNYADPQMPDAVRQR